MTIKNYVILDASGVYPVTVGANFTVPQGAIEVELDAIDYQKRILVDGLWEERPVVSPPVIMADGVVRFTGLPKGSVATVIDRETGGVLGVIVETDGTIEFQLTDPATYAIEVNPPLPWIAWRGNVTC